MNRKIIKAVCLLLTVAMLFSAVGCGGTEDVWSEWIEVVEVSSDSQTTDSSDETVTSLEDTVTSTPQNGSSSDSTANKKQNIIKITSGSKSKYKIVVSLSNEGYDEGRLIQKVIKATSNASVPLILDTENSNGPEIIIGETTRELSQKLQKSLGANEYAIKTDTDGNIVIVGAHGYALQLAVESFLTTYFGYDKNATKIGAGKEKNVPVNLNIKKNMLDDYKLTWCDEFEGSKVDTNKWNFSPLMKDQPNLALRHDETAVKVEGGNMNLIAGRVEGTTDKYWTNTALTTSETMVFKYGYLEMRAKVPFGKPAFPSFWMQSNAYNAEEPLVMSEVDMFEHFCTIGDDYLQTGCHKWYRDGTGDHFVGPQIGKYNFGSIEEAEKWHTYSLLWTEESMNFMVDGVTYHTIDITKTGDFGTRGDGMGAFHDYHHLIFNNYINTEGGSVGSEGFYATPDDEFPITYVIDYIRLYQLPGQGDVVNLKEVR